MDKNIEDAINLLNESIRTDLNKGIDESWQQHIDQLRVAEENHIRTIEECPLCENELTIRESPLYWYCQSCDALIMVEGDD